MKKRTEKLSLHRETILKLTRLTDEKLAAVAAGEMTSCFPDCAKEPILSFD